MILKIKYFFVFCLLLLNIVNAQNNDDRKKGEIIVQLFNNVEVLNVINPGVGLAAPQVGVNKRMFVMDCVKDPDLAARPLVLINPEITWASEDLTTYEEGCLSIPDQYADVERPSEVRVRWLGLDGKTQEEQFAGLWATCAQHEIDHLDGKLFIDYLRPLKRQMITRKMEKLKRELARG